LSAKNILKGMSAIQRIGSAATVVLSLVFGCGMALGAESAQDARLYAGVLSDAHAHVIVEASPDYIVSAMDQANVDTIIIMRKEDKVSDEDMLAYHHQSSDCRPLAGGITGRLSCARYAQRWNQGSIIGWGRLRCADR
jgi:hypothetical protein